MKMNQKLLKTGGFINDLIFNYYILIYNYHNIFVILIDFDLDKNE